MQGQGVVKNKHIERKSEAQSSIQKILRHLLIREGRSSRRRCRKEGRKEERRRLHERNRGKTVEHEILLHRRSKGGLGREGTINTMSGVMRTQMMAGNDKWNVIFKSGS